MNDKLIVSVSPHYHKQDASTQRVMLASARCCSP